MTGTTDNNPKPETVATGEAASRQESLIEYPSQFPIKVMGEKVDGMVAAITATSREQLDELYRTLGKHPMVKVVL